MVYGYISGVEWYVFSNICTFICCSGVKHLHMASMYLVREVKAWIAFTANPSMMLSMLPISRDAFNDSALHETQHNWVTFRN